MTSPTPLTVESIMKEFETDIFPSINIGYDGGYHDAKNRDKYIAFFKDRLSTLTTQHTKEKEELVKEAIRLSDVAESGNETEFNEWRAFKGFRNGLRDWAREHNITI